MSDLRKVWAAVVMSMNRFAHLHPIDKGTLSRYLNGKRVPRDHWLLDKLLALQAEQGKEVSQEVREHLTRLQLNALEVAHPHEYRVRMVSDELELAVVGQREAERYTRSLEEQLAGRIRQTEELTDQHSTLRAAWDTDRAALHTEKACLDQEITDLTQQLAHAHQRATQAEQRCQHLEELLNRLEAPHNDSHDVDGSIQQLARSDPSIMARLLHSLRRINADLRTISLTERAAAEVTLNDPAGVANLLDSLRQAGADTQFRMLAERVAAEAPIDHPDSAYSLLKSLLAMEAGAAAAVLAKRAARRRPRRQGRRGRAAGLSASDGGGC